MQCLSKENIINATLILILGVVIYLSHSSGMFSDLSAAGLRDYIASCGVFGPIVYMAMFSIIPSGSVIAVAGGMAFGFYWGSVYTIIGAVIGSTVAFYLSRLLGRGIIEKLVSGKMHSFDQGLEKGGFLLVLIMRLIPIIPFNVVSYGAGLTRIKFSDYILSTMIGIIPGVLVFTNLGDKALNLSSPEFMLAAGILALMIAASVFLKRRFSFDELQAMVLRRYESLDRATR